MVTQDRWSLTTGYIYNEQLRGLLKKHMSPTGPTRLLKGRNAYKNWSTEKKVELYL